MRALQWLAAYAALVFVVSLAEHACAHPTTTTMDTIMPPGIVGGSVAMDTSQLIKPCVRYGWSHTDIAPKVVASYAVWVKPPGTEDWAWIASTAPDVLEVEVCVREFNEEWEMSVVAHYDTDPPETSFPSIPFRWVRSFDQDANGAVDGGDFGAFMQNFGKWNNGVEEFDPFECNGAAQQGPVTCNPLQQ